MKKNLVVIGLGYVGLPLAINAAKNGFTVYGFDTSVTRINSLKNDHSLINDLNLESISSENNTGSISFTSNISDVPGNSIFVIAVPTPLDDLGQPDLGFLRLACESIAKVVIEGSLIISESTSYIGTLRNFIKRNIFELTGIENINYGIAPERIDPGNNNWDIRNTPRIISGLDEISIQRTFNFYKEFCNEIVITSTPEVAEATKLLENTFRLVNIALINQFSELTCELGLSTFEIVNAAATKPFGFMQFLPSIGVGGHCIPVDPVYLIHSAKKVNLNLGIVELARDINLEAPKKVVGKIQKLLKSSISGKKIQVIGISYKVNIADIRESPAPKLIQELESAGAIVSWHDPLVKEFMGKPSSALSTDVDLGLLISPHDCIDLNPWRHSNIKVFDLSANLTDYGWPKIL